MLAIQMWLLFAHGRHLCAEGRSKVEVILYGAIRNKSIHIHIIRLVADRGILPISLLVGRKVPSALFVVECVTLGSQISVGVGGRIETWSH